MLRINRVVCIHNTCKNVKINLSQDIMYGALKISKLDEIGFDEVVSLCRTLQIAALCR